MMAPGEGATRFCLLVCPMMSAVLVKLLRLKFPLTLAGTLAPVKVMVLLLVTAVAVAVTSVPPTVKTAVKLPVVVTGSDKVTTNVSASPDLPS